MSAKPKIVDVDTASVKRLAWAFGCAKKDSATEAELYRALVAKVMGSRHAGGEGK